MWKYGYVRISSLEQQTENKLFSKDVIQITLKRDTWWDFLITHIPKKKVCKLPPQNKKQGIYKGSKRVSERKKHQSLSCVRLCNPMDQSSPGSSVHRIIQAFYWIGQTFLSPGDLPNPEIEPRSPIMQADSLCLSYQGNHMTHNFNWTWRCNEIRIHSYNSTDYSPCPISNHQKSNSSRLSLKKMSQTTLIRL